MLGVGITSRWPTRSYHVQGKRVVTIETHAMKQGWMWKKPVTFDVSTAWHPWRVNSLTLLTCQQLNTIDVPTAWHYWRANSLTLLTCPQLDALDVSTALDEQAEIARGWWVWGENHAFVVRTSQFNIYIQWRNGYLKLSFLKVFVLFTTLSLWPGFLLDLLPEYRYPIKSAKRSRLARWIEKNWWFGNAAKQRWGHTRNWVLLRPRDWRMGLGFWERTENNF